MIVTSRRPRNRARKHKQSGPVLGRSMAFTRTMFDDLITATAVNPTPAIRDIPRLTVPPVTTYTVKQNYFVGGITSSSTPVLGSMSFALSSIGNVSSYQTIFDAWRIKQVVVRFIPTSSTPAAGSAAPPLLTVIDYDDSNTPTSVADLRNYDTLHECKYGGYLERVIRPRAANAAYSGTFTSFSQMPPDTWVDIASPGVQYYGLKYGLSATTIAAQAWEIEADIIFQFKSVR